MSIEKIYIRLALHGINFKKLARQADEEIEHQTSMIAIKAGMGLLLIAWLVRVLTDTI